MPWDKVLESGHIDFVVDMLVVEGREGIINPFACLSVLVFRGKYKGFIGSHSAFDVEAPGLFEDQVIDGSRFDIVLESHENGISKVSC